jgi:hypothetical protein
MAKTARLVVLDSPISESRYFDHAQAAIHTAAFDFFLALPVLITGGARASNSAAKNLWTSSMNLMARS